MVLVASGGLQGTIFKPDSMQTRTLLQPSTIDGYWTAIADKVSNFFIEVILSKY